MNNTEGGPNLNIKVGHAALSRARNEAALALMTLNSLWNPAFRATAKRQEEIAELLADALKNESVFAQSVFEY